MAKRLLLTSQASAVSDIVKELLPTSPKKLKVGFIPTAGNPYPDKPWMDDDRLMLAELGLEVFDVDIKNKNKEELRNLLKDIDVLFVAGGNTFYLLDKVKSSGFGKIAKELIDKGVLYIGSSAGSMILGSTIETAHWQPADENSVNLKDLTALGLVNFLISPHFKEEKRESVEKAASNTKFPTVVLTDQQAVLCIDGKCKIIGEGEKFTFNGFKETL